MGGGTLMRAAEALRAKVAAIGAHLLEAAVDDVTISDGRVFVRGTPDRFVTLAEIGDAAYRRLAGKLPEDVDPTLEARVVFDPENFAWSYGCSAAMVEVITRMIRDGVSQVFADETWRQGVKDALEALQDGVPVEDEVNS